MMYWTPFASPIPNPQPSLANPAAICFRSSASVASACHSLPYIPHLPVLFRLLPVGQLDPGLARPVLNALIGLEHPVGRYLVVVAVGGHEDPLQAARQCVFGIAEQQAPVRETLGAHRPCGCPGVVGAGVGHDDAVTAVHRVLNKLPKPCLGVKAHNRHLDAEFRCQFRQIRCPAEFADLGQALALGKSAHRGGALDGLRPPVAEKLLAGRKPLPLDLKRRVQRIDAAGRADLLVVGHLSIGAKHLDRRDAVVGRRLHQIFDFTNACLHGLAS